MLAPLALRNVVDEIDCDLHIPKVETFISPYSFNASQTLYLLIDFSSAIEYLENSSHYNDRIANYSV